MNGNHFDIHDLKREYEKGRKLGAVEELKGFYKEIVVGKFQTISLIEKKKLRDYIEKRLKELESKGVN